MCYEKRDGRISALCQERDYLNGMLKATEKVVERLKQENAELRELCEKQARVNKSAAALALELDKVTAERDALLAQLEGKDGL